MSKEASRAPEDTYLPTYLIKYIGGVIEERLGHMYGLQVYYYRDHGDAGISIAGREPKYFHSVTPVAAGPVVYPLFAPF